jgi:hypothetical protein
MMMIDKNESTEVQMTKPAISLRDIDWSTLLSLDDTWNKVLI